MYLLQTIFFVYNLNITVARNNIPYILTLVIVTRADIAPLLALVVARRGQAT